MGLAVGHSELVYICVQFLRTISFFPFLFFFFFGHAACWLFPNQGSNLCPLQCNLGVLTTGPPENSQYIFFF